MANEESAYNKLVTEQILQGLKDTIFEKKFGGKYLGSRLQKETYTKIANQDIMYSQYINDAYGSYENYLQIKKLNENITVFDPTVHYIMDVTVITEEEQYKSDHISPDAVIMEALSGVCTVYYVSVNGSAKRLNGTLERDLIPTSQYRVRANFFSPLPGDRIVMWDLNKQGWSSFYMNKAIKFIRDDTVGLE
jgi:hypothetical protein